MPQPIDLQSELSRVTAAERVQHVAERASQLAQHRAAIQQQQQQAQAENQVQRSRHADERAGVDPDENEKDRGRRKSRRGIATDPSSRTFYTSEERPEVVDDPEEHHIDLKA